MASQKPVAAKAKDTDSLQIDQRRGRQSLAKLVPYLLRPLTYSQKGWSSQISLHWQDIVGPDLFAITSPKALKFTASKAGQSDDQGGILSLYCPSAAATLLNFRTSEICQKVNYFFGRQICAKVSLIHDDMRMARKQAQLAEAAKNLPPQIKAGPKQKDIEDKETGDFAHIKNQNLRRQLARLSLITGQKNN